MRHLKKFEELTYSPIEKQDYQSKVDKIIDGLSKTIEYKESNWLESNPIKTAQARIKLNVNIDDSYRSDLIIKFIDCTVKVYLSNSDKKAISIYKPQMFIFTENTVEEIFDIISRTSDYLGLSSKELQNCYNALRKCKNNSDYINTDVQL